MTLEEMAAELKKAGWRVQEPLTQENCTHPRKLGNGVNRDDGSGYSDEHCPDCGWRSKREWGPRARPTLVAVT